jgi:AcrR family transcriptional regulator
MPQQRSEKTHARILETARSLFARNGYEATGVAEMCAEARISKGAFYHHFPSKHAVFMELLQGWLDGLDAMLQVARQETTSVPQAILQMAGMMETIFQAAGQQLPMFLEFWTQASRDKTVWQTTIAPYRRFQAFFTGLIQEGIDEGSFWPVDPEATGRLILSFAIGVLLQGLLDPQGADWQKVTQQGIRLILKGISQ